MMGKDENKNLMTIVALPYVWYQESSKEIIFFIRKMFFSCSCLLWKKQRKKLNIIEINWNLYLYLCSTIGFLFL